MTMMYLASKMFICLLFVIVFMFFFLLLLLLFLCFVLFCFFSSLLLLVFFYLPLFVHSSLKDRKSFDSTPISSHQTPRFTDSFSFYTTVQRHHTPSSTASALEPSLKFSNAIFPSVFSSRLKIWFDRPTGSFSEKPAFGC